MSGPREPAAEQLVQRVQERRRELNAVVLAHFYQPPEIQDLADFVGDSLQLSVQAAETEAAVIVFCGVRFMAESAKILNPARTVVLPEPRAGCPMADMVTAAQLREARERTPGLQVVCYVNSSAEVKAESDICCTSSNAVRVVRSLDPDRPILFVPDRNLAHFVSRQTGRQLMVLEGCCPIHDRVTLQDLQAARRAHPGAEVMVHPECRPEVTEAADQVLSTGGMLEYVGRSPAREFIVGTEEGLLYPLRKRYPDRQFHLLRAGFVCPDMKLITLPALVRALERLEERIEVEEGVRVRAETALRRMLELR
ncbi:MAG: quinolinate synthase NadA [Syntrophomonadaceae bacterium]|nr:quinolinate synthase NadA [Syntrophomonadaceae bacterium]MDH7497940.1 quinolinate synthase NadA [Syntrophomonadaceae bacterium]